MSILTMIPGLLCTRFISDNKSRAATLKQAPDKMDISIPRYVCPAAVECISCPVNMQDQRPVHNLKIQIEFNP